MTLESIAAKLDRNYAQGREILKALKGEAEKVEWVKLETVKKQTGLTFEQIRYARVQNPQIARSKGTGRYEYNLSAYKQIAA